MPDFCLTSFGIFDGACRAIWRWTAEQKLLLFEVHSGEIRLPFRVRLAELGLGRYCHVRLSNKNLSVAFRIGLSQSTIHQHCINFESEPKMSRTSGNVEQENLSVSLIGRKDTKAGYRHPEEPHLAQAQLFSQNTTSLVIPIWRHANISDPRYATSH